MAICCNRRGVWTEHPHTSHFLVFARMFHNVARDIGSRCGARHVIHVSCACVSALSSTLYFAFFTVSLIFYFILLIFHNIFYVGRIGENSPVRFREWGVWPFGQQRPSHNLPASQRQTHLHATCTAGRTTWGTEAGQRGRGFSDHEFIPATVPIEFARETTRRTKLEVGAQGFGWDTFACRACAFAGRQWSRLPNSMARADWHSTASAWENFCEIITCRRRTLTFPWERLSLDPSPTLRSTLCVFRLLFNVHSCCALHHDGDRLQLAAAPGRRHHRTIQCVFWHQLTYGLHE